MLQMFYGSISGKTLDHKDLHASCRPGVERVLYKYGMTYTKYGMNDIITA